MVITYFFLVTAYQYFSTGSVAGKSEQINYTELVKEITDDNVKEFNSTNQMEVLSKFRVFIKILKQVKKKQVFSFSPSVISREIYQHYSSFRYYSIRIAKACY